MVAHIDPGDIVKLGQLNTRLRFWYHSYRKRVWDMVKFVRQYINTRPAAFLALMDGNNALIYGEAVLRFFLRCKATPECPLDVCANISKVYYVHRALINDGYSNVSREGLFSESMISQLVGKAIGRSSKRDYASWFLTGDRSVDPEDHLGFKFRYKKRTTGAQVNLHFIRCEPYRHVLASPLSPLTCFMMFDRAVSPFARSTFCEFYAFTLQTRRLSRFRDLKVADRWVVKDTSPKREYRFEAIFGPPDDIVSYDVAETGSRGLCDKYCWTIFRVNLDPMEPLLPRQWHRFEVIDWRLLHDEGGTYMKIGEPFVLRYSATAYSINTFITLRLLPSQSREFHMDYLPQPEYESHIDAHWENLPFLRNRDDHKFPSVVPFALRTVDALVLRVGSNKAETWTLPVHASQEVEGVVHDEVIVNAFFPAGCLSVVLCTMPDSSSPLPFSYRVYLDNYRTQRPLNRAVDTVFDQLWMGNIVVVKYARSNSSNRYCYVNMQRGEAELLLCILGDWLRNMWNGMFNRNGFYVNNTNRRFQHYPCEGRRMFTAARVSAARCKAARTFATAVTEVGNGVRVAAVEKSSAAPTASLTVLVKAGSRFESKEGVANALKNFAFKSTAKRTALGTVRESDLYGGLLSSTLGREHLALSAEFLKGDE
ncbi:hypothetical protein NMY22_g1344 [Coprinellus aureogranulatus]|nr:hypothetical protein NMY22_g1344 [Coprinellus aureogranulatus]